MATVNKIKATNNTTYDIACDWKNIDNLPYNFKKIDMDCIQVNTLHVGSLNGEGGKIVFGDTEYDDVEGHNNHFTCIEETPNDELTFKANKFNFEMDVENEGSEFRVTGGPIIIDAKYYIEGNLAGNADSASYAKVAGQAESDSEDNIITETYLKLSGGTMTGSIVTPKNDNEGILPYTNNYGQIGSSSKKFYRMYATTFYGALSGNATTATSAGTATTAGTATNVRSDITSSAYYLCGSTNSTTQTSGILVKRSDVYVNTSGKLVASAFVGNLEGNATSAYTAEAAGTAEVATTATTAGTANCLADKSKGSATNPVYINASGRPVACTYSLSKSVPSTAVLTDTVNTVGATTTTSILYFIGTTTSTSTASQQSYKNVSVRASGTALYATGGFYESSDERLKDFSNKIDVDLDKISKIKKHRFTWKDSEDKKEQIGVSAQEIRELYPEIVSENEEGYLHVSYDKLAVVALAAIDELHKKNKELEARIELLESKLLN